MKKRILSVLLALCMCLTFVPVTVLAEDLQQGNGISVLSITPDEDTYYTYVFTVDGKEINRQIVKDGDTLLEPQVPAQDGKVFTGWSPKVTFGPVSGLTGENQTFEVEAQFEYGYHVYFKDDSGRIIATETVTNGTKVTFEDVNFPVGSDEAITGWYTDKDYTNKVDSVTINGADITLYAKVEKGYWLTFESNGGSYVAPAFYANGTPAAAPDKPTKSGYTFAGWFTDKELTQTADVSNITATTTLYAKWTEKGNTSYTVIHWLENADDDGYSYQASETKTGTTGSKTKATAKSYTGFTAQTITQETIKGDGSTIVSVYYKRNVYEVKFFTDRNGKNEDTSLRITAKYGANISDKWPGGGWYVSPPSMYSSTAQSNIDTMPLNGKNFYGQQSGYQTYNAYYYTEVLPGQTGDTTVGSRTYKLDHTDTIRAGRGLKVTDEERYPITGFTCNTDVSTKNGQSYNGAKFYYTRNSYDLVFISGGKTVKTESVKYQASIADYASNKPGNAPAGMEDYVFAGWYASQECTGEAYDFTGKTMPANNITLYAKWVAPTYTVTVYDVDGSSVLKTFAEVAKNSTISSDGMPIPTLAEGETFLGWVQKDGTPFSFSTKINQNYDLYAKVGNNSRYTVTYHSNTTPDATVTDDTMIYAKDVLATVNDNSFRNGDMVFLGWNTKADGTGTTYYPNGTIKVTDNMDLYARWGDVASTVTVTYHSNFGTDQTYVTDAEVNNARITVADYTTLGLPARTGYTFAGWKNNEGTSFSANDSARVNKDGPNDLYAQWTPNTNTAYKVEFYYQGDDGSYPSTASKTEPRTGTTDATVSVTDADKADKENGKYTFDKDNTANVESGTVAADGSLVLKLYFKLNQADVTVNYYWNETTNTVATSKTLTAQTVGSVITTETAIAIEGYTALPNQTCNLTVGADASKNVINFYYYKNVELTANSKTETYDGTEKSVSGFTSKVALDSSDVTLTFTPAITVGAKGTNVGTYPANFAEGTEGTVDTTEKYIVTKATPGKLTITQPSHPTRPSTPTKDVTSVKTADGSQMTLWMSMMLASAAGIVFLGKKRKEEQ